MITGSPLELVFPGAVAIVSAAVWLASPALRRNALLRAVLIVSVTLTAALTMLTALVVGVFVLSGGMKDF